VERRGEPKQEKERGKGEKPATLLEATDSYPTPSTGECRSNQDSEDRGELALPEQKKGGGGIDQKKKGIRKPGLPLLCETLRRDKGKGVANDVR